MRTTGENWSEVERVFSFKGVDNGQRSAKVGLDEADEMRLMR